MRIRELIPKLGARDKDFQLIENINLVKGSVGYWSNSYKQWIGQRYVGFVPYTLLGNINFEDHMKILIKDPQKRDQLIKWARETDAKDLVKKIEMALNGYSSQMIANEMYRKGHLNHSSSAAENTINVQLSQVRKNKNIPIPKSSFLKYHSVIQQAIELKQKLYRKGNPKRNSDRAVGQILYDRKVVDNIRSVSALLSLLRKQLRDQGEPVPIWLKPALTKSSK